MFFYSKRGINFVIFTTIFFCFKLDKHFWFKNQVCRFRKSINQILRLRYVLIIFAYWHFKFSGDIVGINCFFWLTFRNCDQNYIYLKAVDWIPWCGCPLMSVKCTNFGNPLAYLCDDRAPRCNGFCLYSYRVDHTICFIRPKESFIRSGGHFIFVTICLPAFAVYIYIYLMGAFFKKEGTLL